MTMKIAKVAFAASVLAFAGCQYAPSADPDVYAKLLPAPRTVELRPTDEIVPVASFADVTCETGAVAGAPKEVADQAYAIDIAAAGVRVTAGGAAGERYARVTLAQLAKLAGGKFVPAARIVDWPELKWRGFMNDCGRNFLAPEGVKAMIDVAALAKMNLFHWHLADYHGWRLESKRYPKLTAPETMTRQIGKFYTQAEFKEIVAYAKARGIVVMPELDVPGHTLALRKGLGISTMKEPGTDRIVSELFAELCSLASPEDMPFVHLGTDEVRVDPEYVPEGWCSKWADTVAAAGRATVVWAPGQPIVSKGEVIDMVWHDNHVTNTANRSFDSARMYFASTGPELILNQAAFVKPCRWEVDAARKLGAIACAWHDDNVGDDTLRLFGNAGIVPGILAYADNYWSGRQRDLPEFRRRLPPVGSPEFDFAAAFEKRLVAMREKVLKGFPYAIPYLAQTDQRWRLSWADGKMIEPCVAGGLVDVPSFTGEKKGTAVAETWVWSPRTQTVNAWIGFSRTGTAYVRREVAPYPEQGKWSRFGSTVEVNGRAVKPPVWKHPGAKSSPVRDPDGKSYKGAVYSDDLTETAIEDEWYFTRPPSRVQLKSGWNHVKLVLPAPDNVNRHGWLGVFRLFNGTSEHPREVPGLKYSADPQ